MPMTVIEICETGETTVGKNQDAKKAVKKDPLKSPKEKKAEKKVKKEERKRQ